MDSESAPAPLFPSDAEIEKTLATVLGTLGEDAALLLDTVGIHFEELLRLYPLMRCLNLAREHYNLSVTAVAQALNVSQRAVNNIEVPSNLASLDVGLLLRYVELLDLQEIFGEWCGANPELAGQMMTNLPSEPEQDFAPMTHDPNTVLTLFPNLPADPASTPKLPLVGEKFRLEPGAFKLSGDTFAIPVMETDGLFSRDDSDGEASSKPEETPVADVPAGPSIFQFKITLRHIKPAVWRRIQVPSNLTFEQLHSVIQAVMGWYNCHLHEFTLRGAHIGVPDPEYGAPVQNEKRCRLSEMGLRPKNTFNYTYDFGDSWEHQLVLERILPMGTDAIPVCVKGARACPPEDSGGPWGYSEKLEILRNPKHPNHKEIAEWMSSNFDPELFELEFINQKLISLARSWSKRKNKRK